MVTFYHGTSSACAEGIVETGFHPVSYFTTSLEDAVYYAATGGEWELQRREEAWEAENGERPRDEYDSWQMFRLLFPLGQHPVVIVLDMPDDAAACARPDAGAEGGLVFDNPIPSAFVSSLIHFAWEPDDLGPPEPAVDFPSSNTGL